MSNVVTEYKVIAIYENGATPQFVFSEDELIGWKMGLKRSGAVSYTVLSRTVTTSDWFTHEVIDNVQG